MPVGAVLRGRAYKALATAYRTLAGRDRSARIALYRTRMCSRRATKVRLCASLRLRLSIGLRWVDGKTKSAPEGFTHTGLH
eukprot:29642-Pelagococcus_subviridis.AAC.12